VTCIVVCLALLQSQILLVFSSDQIGNSTLSSEDGAPQKSSKQPSAKVDNGGKKVVQEQINHPPIADAGKDLTVTEGNVLHLDGSSSTDEDGDKLTLPGNKYLPTFLSFILRTRLLFDLALLHLKLQVTKLL
jgi:hypothetical protein